MRWSLRRSFSAVLPVLVLLAATMPAEAREGRSSARGRSAATHAGPSAARASARAGGSTRAARGRVARGPRTVARGHATYGYRGHAGYGHFHYYAPWYYGYAGYWSWGWPYYWGWWYPGPSVVYLPERGEGTRAPAVVETDVRPKKATLVVDGIPRGQARDFNGKWDQLYLEPGTHDLWFRYDGRRALHVRLHALPGAYYRIEERLAEGEGEDELTVGSPPASRPSGDVEPEPRGVGPAAAGASTEESRTGLRQGLLKISAEPEDAAVYLDGDFLARAGELARLHGAVPVAQGRHVIEVVRPGYEPERREVTVEGDQPVRLELRLRPRPQGER